MTSFGSIPPSPHALRPAAPVTAVAGCVTRPQMATGRPEIIRTRTAHAGWSKLLVATIRLPDGSTIEREIEEHGAAVCVLPYNAARRTATLVRQFRAAVLFAAKEGETLEAIAGILEESDPAAGARREAMEEAGLTLTTLERVCTGWTMPGLSTERMHFYLAPYGGEARADRRGGVASEHEEIVAGEIGPRGILTMGGQGGPAHGETLLLVPALPPRPADPVAPRSPAARRRGPPRAVLAR